MLIHQFVYWVGSFQFLLFMFVSICVLCSRVLYVVLIQAKNRKCARKILFLPLGFLLQGVIHKPRGQDFDHFWPPTYPTWTSMDISLTTYLCLRGHLWIPLPWSMCMYLKIQLSGMALKFIIQTFVHNFVITFLIFKISFSNDKWNMIVLICFAITHNFFTSMFSVHITETIKGIWTCMVNVLWIWKSYWTFLEYLKSNEFW